MDKLTNRKSLIDSINLLEGDEFEYNETAILNEYQLQVDNKSSLAIKILSIIGGLMATIAFLGFLVAAKLYNSELGLLIFGIAFIILAIGLNKIFNKLIIDTFSISLYIIGFILLTYSLLEIGHNDYLVFGLTSIIAICSLFIVQNYILSFISILIVTGSILSLIISNDVYFVIHFYIGSLMLIIAYLFLNEAKIISSNSKLSKLYAPLRIGSIISLLFGLFSIGKKYLVPIDQNQIWLSSIVILFVIIYLVRVVLKINDVESIKSKILIYSFSCLILISTILSPAISGAIAIILLCFLVNYKVGFAIGIVSLIYFISQYYYDLSFTLLTKSIMLFSTGVVFLLFYLFTMKKLNNNEKI